MFNIGHKGELIGLWCSCSCSQHSSRGEKAAHLRWKGKPAQWVKKLLWEGGQEGSGLSLPTEQKAQPAAGFQLTRSMHGAASWCTIIRGTGHTNQHTSRKGKHDSKTSRREIRVVFHHDVTGLWEIWLLFVSLPLLLGQIFYFGKSFPLPSFHFLSLNQVQWST